MSDLAKRFDDDLCSEITVDLLRVLASYDPDANIFEIRSAMVKALASITAPSVLHGTDEDVHKASLDLRGEIYSAIMRARRTLLLDIKRNPPGA